LAKPELTIGKAGPDFQLCIAASPSVTQDALNNLHRLTYKLGPRFRNIANWSDNSLPPECGVQIVVALLQHLAEGGGRQGEGQGIGLRAILTPPSDAKTAIGHSVKGMFLVFMPSSLAFSDLGLLLEEQAINK
jgi:hypothetical protein